MPGGLYLAALMVFVPLAFYLPVHLLMKWLGWDVGHVSRMRRDGDPLSVES